MSMSPVQGYGRTAEVMGNRVTVSKGGNRECSRASSLINGWQAWWRSFEIGLGSSCSKQPALGSWSKLVTSPYAVLLVPSSGVWLQVERQWVAQSREAAGQPHAAGLVGMTDVQAELIQGSSKPVSSNTGLHDTRQQQQQQQAQEGATGAGEDAGGDGESCGWDGGTEERGQQCSWDGTSQREAEVEDLAEHSEL